MKLPPFVDVVAALVTVILVLAVVIYPVSGTECPQIVAQGFALGLGWTFRAGVAVQNGLARRNGGARNGTASPTGPAPPGPQ